MICSTTSRVSVVFFPPVGVLRDSQASSSSSSSVLRSHPDFAGVPRPAVPALTVAAVAQTVACEGNARREAVS